MALARGGAAPRLCLDARLRPPQSPDCARSPIAAGPNLVGAWGAWAFAGGA